MEQILHINTIHQNNEYMGIENQHPLVTIVDWSEVKPLRNIRKNIGLYCIFLKDGDCGNIRYGRDYYDYQDGTLSFIAPGQVAGGDESEREYKSRGKALFFHPDLLFGTPLAGHIKEYTFFSYAVNEALHISEEEKQIFVECLANIKIELHRAIDKHSNQIIASNIELLLNYCRRFYDRQFITRVKVNSDAITRFEELLSNYFSSDKPQILGLPTVKYCAERLCFSSNYFGDMVKKETGKTAQEYIQSKIMEFAKSELSTTAKTISEIAYSLGFQQPSHFTSFFKKSVGQTPMEYRKSN